jgi:hypothetical protein
MSSSGPVKYSSVIPALTLLPYFILFYFQPVLIITHLMPLWQNTKPASARIDRRMSRPMSCKVFSKSPRDGIYYPTVVHVF